MHIYDKKQSEDADADLQCRMAAVGTSTKSIVTTLRRGARVWSLETGKLQASYPSLMEEEVGCTVHISALFMANRL